MTVEEGIDLDAEIVSVDELQNHGINVSDILKLKSSGICSISVSLPTKT
jgi:meiotic recombination protein DMC1